MAIIRQRYQEQLDDLIKELRRLGANVYVSIENGIKSLSIDDRGFSRQTVKNDKHINQLNYDINERVIMLITKQQPIASDLRMMISSLKIASDLERIGDNASSIANIRLRTKITDDYVLTRLKTMGKLAKRNNRA